MKCGQAAVGGTGSVGDPFLELVCDQPASQYDHPRPEHPAPSYLLLHRDSSYGKEWCRPVTDHTPVYVDGDRAGQPADTVCTMCHNRPVSPGTRASGCSRCPVCLEPELAMPRRPRR